MGKIRKPRPSRAKKHVVVENSDEEEEQIPIDTKENAIQTILDQLQVRNCTLIIFIRIDCFILLLHLLLWQIHS